LKKRTKKRLFICTVANPGQMNEKSFCFFFLRKRRLLPPVFFQSEEAFHRCGERFLGFQHGHMSGALDRLEGGAGDQAGEALAVGGERWLGFSLQRFGSDKWIACRLIRTSCRCRGAAQGGRSPTGAAPRQWQVSHAATLCGRWSR
jgi:hypothetical protein